MVAIGVNDDGYREVIGAAEVFPGAACRRCTVYFYRNVLSKTPKSKRPQVAAMLRAIRAMESRGTAGSKALEVASELEGLKLKVTAKAVIGGCAETLTVHRGPPRALAQDPHKQRHRAPEPGRYARGRGS